MFRIGMLLYSLSKPVIKPVCFFVFVFFSGFYVLYSENGELNYQINPNVFCGISQMTKKNSKYSHMRS